MLKITEIFYSIQGETNLAGYPTVFVRLTGCPLRCSYCDTTHAFSKGEKISIEDIIARVKQYKTKHVTVTGGEPLAQKACLSLLEKLCDIGYVVSLETSGALDISPVDVRVIKIIDLKTPGSYEVNQNEYKNIDYLQSHDQIKIVICDENDYQWAKNIIEKFELNKRCEILLSPSYAQLPLQTLAEWILRDQLQIRLQLQLHKIIWGNVSGR